MTNAEMAELLDKHAGMNQNVSDSYRITSPETSGKFARFAASLRAGAEALLEVDELRAKWKREECAHCNERPGGHEGTIWCAECLNWWRQQSENQALEDAQREVERLRGLVTDIYGIVCRELAEPPDTGALVRIGTLIEESKTGSPAPRDARIAELEADKARWDALEALPYQIEVTMRTERVKHPAMISLREQVDGALKRIAALREAK